MVYNLMAFTFKFILSVWDLGVMGSIPRLHVCNISVIVKAAVLIKVADRAFRFQRSKMFLPRSLVNIQYCDNIRDRDVAC